MLDADRVRALKRLFTAQLDKQPSDLPHEVRVERARKVMDKKLGPIWREEIKALGEDPTGPDMSAQMDEFAERLRQETREEGFHGDDVPCEPEAEHLKKKHKPDSIMVRIIKLLG